MTRQEFDTEIKKILDHYNRPSPPPEITELLWDQSKNMTLEEWWLRMKISKRMYDSLVNSKNSQNN